MGSCCPDPARHQIPREPSVSQTVEIMKLPSVIVVMIAVLARLGNACKCISDNGKNNVALAKLCCHRSWAVYE